MGGLARRWRIRAQKAQEEVRREAGRNIRAPYDHYVKKFVEAGFEVIPSAAALLLALDAVKFIYIGKNAAEYVILTVDRDFSDLLERLGERGRDRVATIEKGTPSETLFPDRAEIIIPIEDLRAHSRTAVPPPSGCCVRGCCSPSPRHGNQGQTRAAASARAGHQVLANRR